MEQKRPFRLYDSGAKRYLRWRCYGHELNAHFGALCEAGWAGVGTTVEVVNIESGLLLAQYTRGLNEIRIWRAHGTEGEAADYAKASGNPRKSMDPRTPRKVSSNNGEAQGERAGRGS